MPVTYTHAAAAAHRRDAPAGQFWSPNKRERPGNEFWAALVFAAS